MPATLTAILVNDTVAAIIEAMAHNGPGVIYRPDSYYVDSQLTLADVYERNIANPLRQTPPTPYRQLAELWSQV